MMIDSFVSSEQFHELCNVAGCMYVGMVVGVFGAINRVYFVGPKRIRVTDWMWDCCREGGGWRIIIGSLSIHWMHYWQVWPLISIDIWKSILANI